jgi:protoporphyrin/coproporphyrin ferrochelatase
MTPHEQVAIVLFNLGGPGDLAAVEPFLVRLFSDREIIELPGGSALQPLVARVIARLRGPSVRANYASIGGGSPQLRITQAQARALEQRLNFLAGGQPRYRVFIAMRYSSPSASEAIGAIASEDIRQIVTLSLFPQYSRASTGSSRAEFDRTLANSQWRGFDFKITHIEHYAADDGYLDALAETVRDALAAVPPDRRRTLTILFSAHGLPQKFIDAGDPYVTHIHATMAGLLKRLKLPNPHVLAYQSRTGPVKWLGPGTEEEIRRLGGEGVKDLLVVPLSFVSDHIETLYEVDLLFARVAQAAGITGYFRPEALNTHPMFIDALAQLVLARAPTPLAAFAGAGAA